MEKVRYVSFFMIVFVICSLLPFGSVLMAKEEFPAGPISLLVGLPPGGVIDITARALAEAVKTHLGQPVVVVNKPGMAGSVMLTFLKTQKPDGYNVGVVGAEAIHVNPLLEKLDYKMEDFTYVRAFGYMNHFVGVLPSSPWKTFKDLVEYAKKNPNKIKYGSWSPFSTTTFQMRLIGQREGVRWVHIPYKGSAPAITSLLGGHTEVVTCASTIVPYAKSGQIRILCVFNDSRSADFPSVPTVREVGYDLPSLSDMTTFLLVVGPKGLTGAPFEKLDSAFSKAFGEPSFVKVMRELSQPEVNYPQKETNRLMSEYRTKVEQIMPGLIKEIEKEK